MKQPRLFFGLAHTSVDLSETRTYLYASRPYAAALFIEGRIPLDGWDAIIRRASSMSTGDYAVDSFGAVLRDTDGFYRALLDDETWRWFRNRIGSVQMLSDELLNTTPIPDPGDPYGQILFVGRVADLQPQDQRKVRMDLEDILSIYLDKKYPQYTLGDAYPWVFEEGDPVDAPDLADTDPGLQIPKQFRDQVIPIYMGPFIRTEVNTFTGAPVSRGMLNTYFMGYTHLTAGSGSVGEPTPEQAALMEPFFNSADWGGWGELVVGLGEIEIPNVYTSNLGEPSVSILNDQDYGTTVLAPGHPGWPFATNYVMRNGFMLTVIYVRGPLLWQHITNVVNITVDTCGWPDEDGNPICKAGFVWQAFLTQHVFANGGRGFTSGPQVPIPTFGVGDRAFFWTDLIQAWQEMTATRLGNDVGYVASIALYQPTTLREILATFNVTFDCFSAKNGGGMLYLFGINDLADPDDGNVVREGIELVRLPAPRIGWREVLSEIRYSYGWDPAADRRRSATFRLTNDYTRDAQQEPRRVSNNNEGTILDLKYTADRSTAADSVGRRLMRFARPPVYQDLPVRIAGVDTYIGQQIRIKHRDGIGPVDVGYNYYPAIIMGSRQVKNDVVLEALMLKDIYANSINGPNLPDEVPIPGGGGGGGQGGGWGWYTWPGAPTQAPPSGIYGPQPTIEPPAGAVSISPGTNIQTVINANPAGTTYALLAGTHTISASLVPKSGDTFVGEFGAILDASGWSSSDGEDGVFRASNNNIDNVTIRNLYIQDGPQYGINAYFSSSGWIVEYVEISGFLNGVSLGIGGILRYSYIHDNVGIFNDPDPAKRGGGYVFNASQGAQVTDNEISFNGQEQKFIYGTIGGYNQDLYIARNYVHDNLGDGLWIDGDGANSIIEDNICDDNGRTGITIEIATTVIVRTNTCRNNGEEGILISATRDSQIYRNVVRDNGGGIALFLDFARLSESYPYWTIDLSGNTISDNTVRSAAPGNSLALLTFVGGGSQTPYLDNTKNNDYVDNTYLVPSSPTGNWFVWNGNKTFTQWQAIPQDTGGSIAIG